MIFTGAVASAMSYVSRGSAGDFHCEATANRQRNDGKSKNQLAVRRALSINNAAREVKIRATRRCALDFHRVGKKQASGAAVNADDNSRGNSYFDFYGAVVPEDIIGDICPRRTKHVPVR